MINDDLYIWHRSGEHMSAIINWNGTQFWSRFQVC